MSKRAVRLNDLTTGFCEIHGPQRGKVVTASGTVYANGRKLARLGDTVRANCGHTGTINASASHVASTTQVGQLNAVLNDTFSGIYKGRIVTASEDVFIENNETAADDAATQTGRTSLKVSESQAAAIAAGVRSEAAAGGDPTRTEPIEYGDGGVGGSSPDTGQSGPVDSGYSSGDPPPNNFDPANNSTFLNFLPHTDPRISPALKGIAERIAQALGETLTITSAYRSPEYNARVGGASNSMHKQGKAIDVVQTGKSDDQRKKFIEAALSMGIHGFGVYSTFTHIDIRDPNDKAAWGPNGSRTSLPTFPWAQETLRRGGYND